MWDVEAPNVPPRHPSPPRQVRDVVESAAKPGDSTLQLLGTLTVRRGRGPRRGGRATRACLGSAEPSAV